MKERILITGGGGMLASELENFYSKKGWEVIAPTHSELDVLNIFGVRDAINSFRPGYVFHTACLHVDASEENPQLAFRLNSEASKNLSSICSEFGVVFVYISSCGYFGDEVKYYAESASVVLKTVYARSKYEGEQSAMHANKKTFAIRPGWLFGGRITHKKNFVYQRYREARASSVMKSACDKFGCPTYTDDLVKKIDELIETGQFGLYHLTNSGGCTRAQYLKKIIENCGLTTKVNEVDSSFFPRKANTPDCELLDNFNLKSLGLSLMPSWEEAIERYAKIMLKEIG